MAKLTSIIPAATAICAALAAASCSNDAPFIGSWTTEAPLNITSQIPGATKATSVLTIQFAENQQKGTGETGLDFAISIEEPIKAKDGKEGTITIPAQAIAKGEWTYDVDDVNDLLMHFDYSTITVDISPADIKISGVHPALVDSLKTGYIESARLKARAYVTSDLARFTTLHNVNVSRNGNTMTFDVNNPSQQLSFNYVDH